MVRTGGAIKKAGALSAGMLIKDLGKHIHPEGQKRLIAGGFFDKLASVINVANKAYSVVNKAIPIVTKGVSSYKSFKTAYDGMKKGGAMSAGAMPTAGAMPSGGAVKKKRTLPPALRDRAKRMGELMKAGKTMKQASEMYKEEQKK
jgi:hypothetical protein